MEQLTDRRSDPRVRVQVRLTLTDPADGRTHVLRTSNLSASGAACKAVRALAFDGEADGRLDLPFSEGGREHEVRLALRARMVRWGRDGEVVLSLEMSEAARDELRRFLLQAMAEDSACPRRLAGTGGR
jgi:hypothetical protein